MTVLRTEQKWIEAVEAWRAGKRTLLADLLASGEPFPASLRESIHYCLLNPTPQRPASPKLNHLVEAVIDVRTRIAQGAHPNDALRTTGEKYGVKESVLDNAALKRTRRDVNEALKRRGAAN